MMSCTTVQKSNVLVFRSKLLKNVHVPELEINNTAIDDELSDDDDMTKQRNNTHRGMH